MRPQHINPDFRLDWSFPSSQASCVTMSDIRRQRHWMSRLRFFYERHQTSQCFGLSSENVGRRNGFRTPVARRQNIHNIQMFYPRGNVSEAQNIRNLTVTAVPSPTLLSTLISPPCKLTQRFTITRPRPVPGRRWKALKSHSRSASGIPSSH